MSVPTFHSFPLEEIVSFARSQSPYYVGLYEGLQDEPQLADLPIIDKEAFWQAHQLDRQSVLTGPLDNGIVLNSGGSTGAPKYSYFSDQEWDSMIGLSSKTYEAAGLCDGDRVANLFASGNLYASFLFATESLKWMRPKVVQFPLGVAPNFAPAAAIIRAFKINVLAGVPSQLLRIIYHLEAQGMDGVRIDRIVYGGELFSQDRRDFLEKKFPGIQICSAGYASVDAGLIGYADAECEAGEHRVFDGAMIMEIIDEVTGESIDEAGKPGRIVFTSLIRRLMPLIRYPSGDRAHWVESPGSANRKFQLLGRSEESARIAHCNLDVSTVAKLLEPFRANYGIEQFQLLVTRENLHDCLTLRISSNAAPPALEGGAEEILQALEKNRADIYEAVRVGTIHAPRLEWVQGNKLILSERTGKLLQVVDRRNG